MRGYVRHTTIVVRPFGAVGSVSAHIAARNCSPLPREDPAGEMPVDLSQTSLDASVFSGTA